ncbi:MAG: hypothetical protein ACI38V_03690 [Bacteroides sp.]
MKQQAHHAEEYLVDQSLLRGGQPVECSLPPSHRLEGVNGLHLPAIRSTQVPLL